MIEHGPMTGKRQMPHPLSQGAKKVLGTIGQLSSLQSPGLLWNKFPGSHFKSHEKKECDLEQLAEIHYSKSC